MDIIQQKICRKIIEDSQFLILIHDINGTIIFANDPIFKISGYRKKDIIGKNIAHFLPENELPEMLIRFEKRKRGDLSEYYYKTKIISAKGTIIPVEVQAFPLEENKKIQHFVLIARDITHLEKINEERDKEKKNYEIILNSIAEAVISLDNKLKINYLNPIACRLLNAKQQDLLRKRITNFFDKKNKKLFLHYANKAFSSGKVIKLKEPLVFKFNHSSFQLENISPVVGFDNKQIEGIVIILHDITEQIKLTQQIKEKDQLLKNIMNDVPGVIFRCLLDEHRTMKYLSEGVFELTGYTVEELIDNHKISFSDLINPEDQSSTYQRIIHELQGKNIYQVSYRINTPNGQTKWVWEQGRKVKDENGTEFLEGYLTDISEKYATQKQIAQLNRTLLAIRNINQLIVREKDEDKLLSRACHLVMSSGDFTFSTIVKIDSFSEIEQMYCSESQIQPFIKSKFKEWFNQLIENDRNFKIINFPQLEHGSDRLFICLLKHKSSVYGCLLLGLEEKVIFSKEEIDLFLEMASDIAYALHVGRMEEESQLVKNSINIINKTIKGRTALEILRSLIRNLSHVLRTEYMVIGKIKEPSKTIETLFIYEKGQIKKNLHFTLKGSAAHYLSEHGTFYLKSNSFAKFKEDLYLVNKKANGFIGTPIFSTTGKIIGVFYGFSTKELPKVELFKEIVEFFAHRIGLEMERLSAEEKLKKSEEKYRVIFENSPIGIYQTSLEGRVLEANPALIKMLGYKNLEDLKRINIEKEGYKDPQNRERFLRKVLSTDDFIIVEDVWLKKDGTQIFVREKARAVKDEKGNVLYIEGTVEDITESKEKKEEQLYQSQLLDAALDPIIATDLNNRITYWNKSAENFYGISKDQAKGKFIEDVIRMHLPFNERLKIRQYVVKHGFWRGEVEQIKPNGEHVYVDMSISLLYDSEHKPKAIVGINRDISDKVRYREALKASDESYRGLYNSVEEAIYIQNPDGTFLDVNDGAVKMYGYPRSYFIGKNPADLSPPNKNDMRMVLEKFKKALKGEPQVFEFWGQRANGEIFPKTVRLYKGTYFGKEVVIALATDISEQKKTEENLRKLTAAVEQSPNSIIITDPEGKIEYVNERFCQVTGYSKEEVLGKNPRILKSGKMPEEVYENLWKTIKSGGIWHGELMNKKKNGTFYWEYVIISPILNEKGEITQFLGLKQDITLRKKLEEEKERLEKQLHQNQRLETIGTLAGGIAHDFNNILTPILGYAEMIKIALKNEPKLQNQAQQIITAALRARDLIQQILTFSRQVEHEQKPVYLQNIVNEAYHLLRASIPATIEVRRNIDKTCKPVLGDPAKLHQVLMNLCTNAYQAMEDKGGQLTIGLKMTKPHEKLIQENPQLQNKEYVCLSVSDTGEGMDEATMERIFEPFFTTKGVGKGTGLGLSVVHGIVKNYHGEIIVESEKGKGSTFYVFFPVVQISKDQETGKEQSVNGGSESILLVDDEKAVLELEKNVLEHFGYKVTALNNPLEAYQYFKKNPQNYDLLITDLTMPNLTGIELAEKITKIKPQFPIILITGYSEELTPAMKKRYGIKRVLMKPIIADQLGKSVRQILDEQ